MIPPIEDLARHRWRPGKEPEGAHRLGRSREGRPVVGWHLGDGPLRVSLIGGCHADEPVGPRFLRLLVGWLTSLPPDAPALERVRWWIVPHVNPDGEARNAAWQEGDPDAYDPVRYLATVVRELPGDDLEFGFPSRPAEEGPRPEARAVHDWWRRSPGPFHLHASLHGMGFAAGPWYLIDRDWIDRTVVLRRTCAERTRELGYVLHDVERHGEKGFDRIERGFCTRPDSRSMRDHFLGAGDLETAGRFRPSSMEAVRAFGGDPLTLVSEMPLFLTPGAGEEIGPPDPALERWKERIGEWRARLRGGDATDEDASEVRREMGEARLRAMPVPDQMELIRTFLLAGLEAVRRAH